MGVVVRSRHDPVTAAVGVCAGPPRGQVPPPSARIVLELQRAGYHAVGPLLTHATRTGTVVPVVQRRPAGEYGLDVPAREHAYVKQAVTLWRTQKHLSLRDFASMLPEARSVADLKRQGVPEVTWNWATLGAAGRFNSELWVIDVDVGAFGATKAVKPTVNDLTPAEVTEVVGTLYHEARHADQDVLIIRQLLAAKVPARLIVDRTKIRDDVVSAVKRTTYSRP